MDQMTRSALEEFDSPHLLKFRAMIYDRWNWDSGNDLDKRWLDIAESILEERGANMPSGPVPTLNFGSGGTPDGIAIGAEGNQQRELHICAEEMVMSDPDNPANKQRMFRFNQGSFEINWGLEEALRNWLAREIQSGLTTHNGQTIRQIVEQVARDGVKERL